MMFPPSHDGGDDLETMCKMIQKKKTKNQESRYGQIWKFTIFKNFLSFERLLKIKQIDAIYLYLFIDLS